MNSLGLDLSSTRGKGDYVNTDDPSSKERVSHVHPAPAGTPVWEGPPSGVSIPGARPPPQQHSIQGVMVDPLSLGFHCPCQYSQCQVAGPDYFQSSQCHHLSGPAPGSSDSSHVSSLPAPWFTYEPFLCGVMPAVGHQQFQEQLTEYTSHYTQPELYNVGGGGQEVMVNPHESGPVFHTLKPVPIHRDGGFTQDRAEEPNTYNVSMLTTPAQLPQYHQTARSLHESRGPAPSMQPQAPPARSVGNRKPCHCTRSQCLKLYCECFANGLMCNNCECSNCFNNAEHLLIRQKAIELRSGRNPDAFRMKIVGGRSGEVKGWHSKGCSCKRSGCLKNYCECYEANIRCTSSCKCDGCRNFDDSSGLQEKTVGDKDKCPESVITLGVVETVCGCLLAQAETAEREAQSSSQAEQMVLEEFGQCLTQIVKTMFK